MVEPQNHYEIVGVLREVFGISDHDLAVFSEGNGARFQIEKPVAAAGVVSSQMAELTELRAALLPLPLHAAIEQLIERTALRARLHSLPPEDFKDPLGDLEILLTLAAETGEAGATLSDFAERLRSEMEQPRPVRLSEENALQLITAQKAKGSEWDAVIIPFLSRRITGFSPRYPSLIRVPGKDEIIAALHKEDREEEIKEANKVARRQEMERLLYVALTRARRTLVLVHDRALFSPVHNRLAPESQLKFLRGDTGETSCVTLDALSGEAAACGKTSASVGKLADTPPAPTFTFPPLDPALQQRAKTRAADFIHKQNPSGYEAAAEDELSARNTHAWPRSLGENEATLYGSWWHALFQHFPWGGNTEAHQQTFRAFQASSPNPDRSAAEWQLLQKPLRDSDLAKFVSRAGVITQTEFPFLWRADEHTCLEGVIDLFAVDPAQRRILLVDWKTNQITRKDADKLRLRYLPQLASYWKAVREITAFDVQAALYSTATGLLLLYEETDLETEWSRLAKLPPDQVRAILAPEADGAAPTIGV